MAQNLTISNTKTSALQSKAQKAFNSNIKKIDKLKAEVERAKETARYFEQEKVAKLIPADQARAKVEAEWVKALYRWRNQPGISKKYNEMIGEIVVEHAYHLIDTFNFEELKPMYDECMGDEGTFDEEQAEMKDAKQNELKEMFKAMGIEIDGDITEENMYEKMAEVQEKMQQKMEEEEEMEAARAAKRKKTPKQEAAAAKKAVQAAMETKSIREIYTQLAKEFHPDRESDETERVRKTEIMQRVTAAYEKNDLPELLRLQLELEQISSDSINALADEKLDNYNRVLREQISELQHEKQMIEQQVHMMNPQLTFFDNVSSPILVDMYVKNQVKTMKKETKTYEKEIVTLLGDLKQVKEYLKDAYEVRQEDDDDGFDISQIFGQMFRGM